MYGKEPDNLGSPELRDKRTTPPGVLDKNTRAIVLTSLSLVMVIVIAFSGHNAPKEKTLTTPISPQTPEATASQIREYEARLKAEADKLQTAKDQLAKTQRALGLVPVDSGPSAPQNYAAYPGARFSAFSPAADQNQVLLDAMDREAKSLSAPNVALSFRTPPALPSPPTPPTLTPADIVAKALAAYTPTTPAAPAVVPPGAPGSPASSKENTEAEAAAIKARAAKRDAEIDRFEGKEYRLYEGTILETVLTNRLDGSFSGPVNCMITTNVYSHDGLYLLIPQGSRVLGEAKKVETFGDQRLAVFFHRIVMPDGYSLSLDKFQGLNQIGETGLKDQVNHHYLQVFGVSLAIGAIAGFSQANTNYGIGESSLDAYRQGVSSSLAQSSAHILDRYLNVLPTITILEGHRVKLYLSDDLLLPAYENHRMPSDL
jgi:type IV secretory pathway VirB10-like protein